MKKFIKEIILAVILIVTVAALFILISEEQMTRTIKIIISTSLISIVLVFYLLNEIRKRRERKLNIPIEDEMSRRQKIMAGNKAFHSSLILWLVIFAINSEFDNNETMLGIGILGSALIYGIYLWLFKLKDPQNEE